MKVFNLKTMTLFLNVIFLSISLFPCIPQANGEISDHIRTLKRAYGLGQQRVL